MAWGGSGNSSGGWGGGSTKIYLPQPKKKKKDDGFLPLRFAKNLAGDAVDAAVGLVPGMIETVRNPVKTGKAFAEASWQTWSPLLKGDFGEWGHQFIEHPLAPILDVATIVTLGVGASARVAYSAGNAGRLAKAATTAEGRYINPVVKARRQATGAVLDKAMGAEKRAARAADRKLVRDQHQMGFNIARIMRGAERAAKRGEEVPIDLRTTLAHITAQTARIAQEGLLEPDALKSGRIYLADVTKWGQKEVVASKGSYFHQRKNGTYEIRPLTKLPKSVDPKTVKTKLIAPQGLHIVTKKNKKGALLTKFVNDPGDPMPAGNWTLEEFGKNLHGNELSGRIFTNDPTKAMKGKNGLPLHVNKRIVKDYHAEAANSLGFMAKAYHYPLTVWRNLILGTPRYFVNNAVGNATMALVNNPTAMRYYVEAVRHVKGENEARQILNDNTGSSLPWFDPLFGDMRTVKGHQVGHTAVGSIEERLRPDTKMGKLEKVGNTWFSFVNRVTDEPLRVAATIQRVRSDKHVKELMDKGLSEHDAVMARAADNPEWRHAITNEVENMFGNYHALTRAERNVRNFVPFYSWDRAITRSTKNTVLDRPGRALALAYAGELGSEKTKEALGELPRFLRGAVPGPFEKFMPGISKDPGRENVLTTTGFNPYGTVADLVAGGAAVTGLGGRPSESLGQTLGPFAQTGFEVMTGTDLLTGKPLRTNPLGTLQTNFGISAEQPGLPQLRIIKEALQPGEGTYLGRDGERTEKLYDPSLVREWYQVFGIPIKSLHVKTAQSRAKAEEKGGAL